MLITRRSAVDEWRRIQQRLRWHLHELDPTLVVPLRRLDQVVDLAEAQPVRVAELSAED